MKRKSLKEAARAVALKNLDNHPSAMELLAHHRRELTGEASEKMKEHLANCRSCVAVLITLADQKHDASEAKLQRAWRLIRSKTTAREPRREVALHPWMLRLRPLFLGVASVVILVWGSLRLLSSNVHVANLEQRVAELEKQIVELTEPELDLFVIDLYPRGFGRQGRQDLSLELSRDIELLTVNLNLSNHETYDEYSLEIRHQAEVIWHRRGLKRTPSGAFHVALRSMGLVEGSYELEVYGLQDDREISLGNFVLKLVYD